MKRIASLCLLLPLISLAQTHVPVQWRMEAIKLGSSTYELRVHTTLSKGWYLYAANDTSTGIESPRIKFNSEEIKTISPVIPSLPAIMEDDPVFSHRLPIHKHSLSFQQKIRLNEEHPSQLRAVITAYASNGTEFLPVMDTLTVILSAAAKKAVAPIPLPAINIDRPAVQCGQSYKPSSSLISVFLLGFLGGLIALITPCVFPMIPVTVSYFGNQSGSRKQSLQNGFIYGACIFLSYFLASIPFHLAGKMDPRIFNNLSTNAWVNVLFFFIFLIFALSFFGWFTIQLPSFITNRVGSKGGVTSKAGILFMALTLTLVSFSCTGPILGSLLVGSLSESGGAWPLTMGMSGFGLALGLPFALFALFPRWLKALPKSGSWMEVVKKSLAFVELALAIKFLSNADLVEHWGILKREVFIGLWILIFALLSLYLFGVFDRKKNTLKPVPLMRVVPRQPKYPWLKPRLAFGLLTAMFTLYLIPGITQTSFASLRLLSGFPPPLSYSIYGSENIIGKGIEPNVVNDYQKALKMAREQHKPLLIDFTGWACVNCRKMEENVWSDKTIKNLISKNFILLSLYVDDRKKLPKSERFMYTTSEGEEKEIITEGDRNATFQAVNFRQVSQPLYAVISPDEKLMNNPVGYTPSESAYLGWLECGLQAFREVKD